MYVQNSSQSWGPGCDERLIKHQLGLFVFEGVPLHQMRGWRWWESEVYTHTHKQRHSTHSTPTSNLLKCVWFLSCKERSGARSWLGRLSVPDAVHTVWFDRSDMLQVLFLELVLEIENKQQSIWILTLASLRQVSLSWILWPKTRGFICTESCVQIIYINGCLLSNKEQICK